MVELTPAVRFERIAIVYVYSLTHRNQRTKKWRRASVYNCNMYLERLKLPVNDVEFGRPKLRFLRACQLSRLPSVAAHITLIRSFPYHAQFLIFPLQFI